MMIVVITISHIVTVMLIFLLWFKVLTLSCRSRSRHRRYSRSRSHSYDRKRSSRRYVTACI